MGSTLVDEDDIVEYRLNSLVAACNDAGISVSLEGIRSLLREAVMEQVPATSRVVAKLTDSEDLKRQLRDPAHLAKGP